ncbi:MAG: 50S ribosomal protein L15 [Gemmatimonadota bacterium]
MSNLNDLRPPEGATHSRKRLGRGPGSGSGKTSGKGHKGQKSRSGFKRRAWFEGGQMPLQRRVPKRGFTSRNRVECEIVNVGDLGRMEDDVVTPQSLHSAGLVDLGRSVPVKLLGRGEVERAFTVQVHRVSDGARAKIEAAGGTVDILDS